MDQQSKPAGEDKKLRRAKYTEQMKEKVRTKYDPTDIRRILFGALCYTKAHMEQVDQALGFPEGTIKGYIFGGASVPDEGRIQQLVQGMAKQVSAGSLSPTGYDQTYLTQLALNKALEI